MKALATDVVSRFLSDEQVATRIEAALTTRAGE
jgi:Flp pilus assembly pilin Flp